MTVAYPLTVQKDYTELKYSLRSIEKYLQNPFKVIIIGSHVPGWLTNVSVIEIPDVPGRKQLSIRIKILAALEYAREILFMNDDVYLLHPGCFPYYFHGSLKNYSEPGSKQLLKELELLHKRVNHFDGHYPLFYGQDFKEASKHFSGDCIIKSMYCNYLGIAGIFTPDCKLTKNTSPEMIKQFIKDKPCFSTGALSLQSALPVLNELYPNKSKFEV